MFLEARLHIRLLFLLIFHLKTIIWIIILVEEIFSAHNTHVVNTVRISLTETGEFL